MEPLPAWLKAVGAAGNQAAILAIHAQPGAARSEVSGVHGDALKIRIQAHPVEGAANAALLAFLAKQLGLPKSSLELVSGETSRAKRVRVPLPATTVESLLRTP